MLKYFVGDIIKLKSQDDGSKWKVTGFDELTNTYLLNVDGINTCTNRGFAESSMEKVEARLYKVGDYLRHKDHKIGIFYEVMSVSERFYELKYLNVQPSIHATEIEFAETEMEKITKPLNIKVEEKKIKAIEVAINGLAQSRTIIFEDGTKEINTCPFKPVCNGPVEIKTGFDTSDISFETEYGKRAVSLAIKNNKVQKLIKKVDENKKELTALQDGKWFGLYGRYDWKRIGWTTLFTLLSFFIPGYLAATGFSWLVLGLTPISLAIIATVIYTMRDKKLDAYIIGADSER